jgi:hypothetical protein
MLQSFSDQIDSLLINSKGGNPKFHDSLTKSNQKPLPINQNPSWIRHRNEGIKSKANDEVPFMSTKPSSNKENYTLNLKNQMQHSYSVKASVGRDPGIMNRGLSPDSLDTNQDTGVFRPNSSFDLAKRFQHNDFFNNPITADALEKDELSFPENILEMVDVEKEDYVNNIKCLDRFIKNQETFYEECLDAVEILEKDKSGIEHGIQESTERFNFVNKSIIESNDATKRRIDKIINESETIQSMTKNLTTSNEEESEK